MGLGCAADSTTGPSNTYPSLCPGKVTFLQQTLLSKTGLLASINASSRKWCMAGWTVSADKGHLEYSAFGRPVCSFGLRTMRPRKGNDLLRVTELEESGLPRLKKNFQNIHPNHSGSVGPTLQCRLCFSRTPSDGTDSLAGTSLYFNLRLVLIFTCQSLGYGLNFKCPTC
jgi:hypothetical protein